MQKKINGWLNIYKPRGISSAHVVGVIKRAFRGRKIGHAGTLDLEAEGVLPIAIGEATKLISILMDARKTYRFTVKFGQKTDTADSAGKVIASCDTIPTHEECKAVCAKFLGKISQIPPSYSALKVNGKRAYDLARQGVAVELAARNVKIYSLFCESYDAVNAEATYVCECSKGTYIRTLAEDISLSLQTLGFVIELQRLHVGMFGMDSALRLRAQEKQASAKYCEYIFANAKGDVIDIDMLHSECLRVEYVLDDIPVLSATASLAKAVRDGKKCEFDLDGHKSIKDDTDLLWLKDSEGKILAIGKLQARIFKSSRVFNV
jgi:tRNA pseudouridine55 synthase